MLARCRMASRTGSQWRSGQPRVVRTGSLRTQSARHRVDHGTICGRSCANSGHCKPLCACVDRTKFVAPASVGGPEFFCGVCVASSFWTATVVAFAVVAVELAAISYIRHRFMDTPFLAATFQVVVGGVLVFAAGILIGSS